MFLAALDRDVVTLCLSLRSSPISQYEQTQMSHSRILSLTVKAFTHTHVWFAILVGILHRHNAFSTVQTVYSVALHQRFSIPVLAPPRSAYFVCYSYRFRYLFYSNVSALRSGHHRIFRHDSSSKRTYIFHSKCIEVCKTWIKIVYIYRGIWCHTRPCVKTLRTSMNECSEMK